LSGPRSSVDRIDTRYAAATEFAMADLYTILALGAFSMMCFLPCWVAMIRRHHDLLPIATLNVIAVGMPLSGLMVGVMLTMVLGGFGIIGWIAALIWSFTR
jgi:hypothetical protein